MLHIRASLLQTDLQSSKDSFTLTVGNKMSATFPACRELISLVILQGLDWAGAELFLELLLDLRLRELWDRDVGRSAAIAAMLFQV